MATNPRLLRPTANDSPASIPGLALWLDASAADALYTTDAGPVEPADETEIANLAGLEAWWDASDVSTVTLDSGRVSSLADKSGNGRDAVNATTGTTQPTYETAARNGLNVVRFDAASTQRLTVPSSTATFKFLHDGTSAYVAAVFSTGTVADPNGIFGILGNNATSTSAVGFLLQVDDRTPTFNMLLRVGLGRGVSGGWAVLQETANAFVPNQTYVVEALVDADNAAAANRASVLTDGGGLPATNSSTLAPSASNATYDFQIGTSGANATPHTGDICEILIFSQQPTASQRARIAKYLAAKWGISGVHAPAVTASDPVGYWRDRSGNGRHATQSTAASRPTISATLQNGRKQLLFDATNDRLSLSSGLSLGNSGYSVLAVIRHSGGFKVWLDGGLNPYFSTSPTANAGLYHWDGAVAVEAAAALPAESVAVVSGIISPSSRALYSQSALAATGAGTSRTATIQHIGATSSGFNWNGNIDELIVYSKVLTNAQRRKVEVYLARRWGITLAPQVSNAEAQDWISRVYANGGTVSQSTASAVSTFCDAIESAGIRDRFYRLGIFAGDNLNAALVPLYRGPTFGGTTYGNATDTNNAFVGVGTDYAETGASGGLTGNGSTKYLLTGLTTAAIPSLATGHLSVYAATYPTSGIRGLLTSWGSGFGNPLYVLEANRDGAGDLMTAWGDDFGGRNFTAASGIGAGHLISSRVSGTDLRVFRSGAQVGSTVTASVTPAANTGSGFAVFANYGSAAANYSDARLGAYSVGAGLDSTQAAAYHTAMQAFQTALSRNV